MKKMLNVYAVLLLIACVFALTACPSGSSTSAGGSISHSSGGSGSDSSTRAADKTVPNSSGNSSGGTTSGSSTGSTSDSSGGTAGPSDPALKTYVLQNMEGGKASLTFKDYNTSTFSGNYSFVGEKGDDSDQEYTENGPFTISANPGNKGWMFRKTTVSRKADNTDAVSEDAGPNFDISPDKEGPISKDKILTFYPSGEGSSCKFNLKDVPLPESE